jgi:DNA processing protein
VNIDHLVLQLFLIKEIGPQSIQLILEKIGTAAFQQLLNFSIDDFCQIGFSRGKAQLLVQGLRDSRALDIELELMQKRQVQIVTLLDSDYPERLRHIPGAPAILYWRGNMLRWPEQALAIVGSRQASQYGKSVVQQLVPPLVQAGQAIVSGGAVGIDTMAHQATLAANGLTIAVTGVGLASDYPKSNQRLFEEICERGGACVSIFPMQTSAHVGNFPARNRVISGLATGCIVVQAASRSGARITANFALEQGRDLFVVPGPFGDPLSAGCHELANQGAKLIHTPQDVLVELQSGSAQLNWLSGEPQSMVVQINDPVWQACGRASTTSELQERLGWDLATLQNQLFDLQLQGVLRQNFAGLWERAS